MNKYDSYKPSGIVWIGDIPFDWSVGKMKYILSNNDGGVWGKDVENETEGTYVIRSTEITIDGVWYLKEVVKRILTDEEISKCKLHEGDIVITKSSGSPQHIGKSVIVNKKIEDLNCCFSNFVQRIRFKDNNPKLYHYILNSDIVRSQFKYLTTTTTGLGNLNGTSLNEVILPFIPFTEQQKILEFLDKKTEIIDRLISTKERKIELIKEQRTSIINQVITKGLDPNVKMKDSGVEWIGKIPEHWRVTKGRYILKILTSNSPNEIIEDEEGVNYIKVDDLNYTEGKYYLSTSKIRVKPFGYEPLEDNIIIFPKRGMAIFTNKVVISKIKSFIDPNLMGIKTLNNSNIHYIFFIITNRGLGDICDSSTIPQINNKHIYPLEFPFPTLTEQNQIVEYLDKQTKEIDNLVLLEQKKIDLLKEYRQSLISEVVTGKIDVRTYVN